MLPYLTSMEKHHGGQALSGAHHLHDNQATAFVHLWRRVEYHHVVGQGRWGELGRFSANVLPARTAHGRMAFRT
jgi:hypothetical protein